LSNSKSKKAFNVRTPVKNSDRAVVGRKSFSRRNSSKTSNISNNKRNTRSPIQQRKPSQKRNSRKSFVRTPSTKNMRRKSRSKSNFSNGSRRKTNEKKFRKEMEGIKHLDFMHTLDMKAKSRGRNHFQDFHKNPS
jgi:hypothetical protein